MFTFRSYDPPSSNRRSKFPMRPLSFFIVAFVYLLFFVDLFFVALSVLNLDFPRSFPVIFSPSLPLLRSIFFVFVWHVSSPLAIHSHNTQVKVNSPRPPAPRLRVVGPRSSWCYLPSVLVVNDFHAVANVQRVESVKWNLQLDRVCRVLHPNDAGVWNFLLVSLYAEQ